MKPTLCSRCKKNLAVIFITKIDNGKTINEGLCLKCARELGIKPVDDLMQRMGITDDDLESLSGEMSEALGSLGMMANPQEDGAEDDEQDSQTATFPFLNKLFGGAQNAENLPAEQDAPKSDAQPRDKTQKGQKSTNSSIPIARTSRKRRATVNSTASSAARSRPSASFRSSTDARRTTPA